MAEEEVEQPPGANLATGVGVGVREGGVQLRVGGPVHPCAAAPGKAGKSTHKAARF